MQFNAEPLKAHLFSRETQEKEGQEANLRR